MQIKQIVGGELEKERSNSPEDAFSRMTVTYESNGAEKNFSVLYPTVFESKVIEEEILGGESFLKEKIALCFFERYPERKRLYISDADEFIDVIKSSDLEGIQSSLNRIKQK
ncbi:hypothetical protein [Alkalihalobacillus sp. CinArs1]|uniref:hypothetical protein n=1 Tax=Alkalihalobacillus sp. CinArs1 TaxID=2995314 RepID=UPI0022DD1207|nr:hypothetical protein [Alkalihalobacillus sp. CinArs1]